MARKVRSALAAILALGLAAVIAGATAEVPANQQTKPRHYTLYRTKSGTRVIATSANTIKVRACPDAASLVSSSGADSTGDCIYLTYVSASKTWRARTAKLAPTDNYSRRAFSFWFSNGAGADTLIGTGFVLDEEPGIDVVDGYSILDRTIASVDVDSTSGFTFNTTYQTTINLRETGASGVGLYAPYGTTDATGSTLQLGGSGSSIGKALFVKEWNGYGLHLTRKGSVSSGQDAVYLDLSAETDTAAVLYGQKVNYAGTGKESGLYLTRQSGTRKFDSYGLKVEAIAPAQTQSGFVNYGAYVRAAATVTGTSKNIGLEVSATTTAGGRAIYTPEGDVQLGDAGDSDSLLVNLRERHLNDTRFDKPPGVAAPFAGRFLMASGDSTVTVACTGIDATNYEVLISPRNNWDDKVLWAVAGTNQFIVHCTAAASGAYSGAYLVIRKF